MIELRLLPTGVLACEIQTPSTSRPRWIARIPNGISSLVSSLTAVTGCASSISGVCTCLPLSTLLYLRILCVSYHSFSRPRNIVPTWNCQHHTRENRKESRTIPQPKTCATLACDGSQEGAERLTKVIFCHNAQLLKNSLPPEVPKPMTATKRIKYWRLR